MHTRRRTGATPADLARVAGHSNVTSMLSAAAADPQTLTQPHDCSKCSPHPLNEAERTEVAVLLRSGVEGWGSPGTRPRKYTHGCRVLIVLAYVAWSGYLGWRALRTLGGGLNPWLYFYRCVFVRLQFQPVASHVACGGCLNACIFL